MEYAEGAKVLILRQACALSPERRGKKKYEVTVDESRCRGERLRLQPNLHPDLRLSGTHLGQGEEGQPHRRDHLRRLRGLLRHLPRRGHRQKGGSLIMAAVSLSKDPLQHHHHRRRRAGQCPRLPVARKRPVQPGIPRDDRRNLRGIPAWRLRNEPSPDLERSRCQSPDSPGKG